MINDSLKFVFLFAISTAAVGQSAPPTTPTASKPPSTLGICDALQSNWQSSEKELSYIAVKGIDDNSVPRATLRLQERTNELLRMTITLDLMKEHKCKMPTSPPSEYTYLVPALGCKTEEMQQSSTASKPANSKCDRTTWMP